MGLRKAIEGYRGNVSRMKLVIKFRIHLSYFLVINGRTGLNFERQMNKVLCSTRKVGFLYLFVLGTEICAPFCV